MNRTQGRNEGTPEAGTRRVRRGISLTEIVFLLPIIAAMSTVLVQVTVRSIQAEGRAGTQVNVVAGCDELLRRLQDEIASAQSAALEAREGQSVLTLTRGSAATQPAAAGVVRYTFANERIAREASATGPQPRSFAVDPASPGRQGPQPQNNAAGDPYEWKLPGVRIEPRLEEIAGKPSLVWITFVTQYTPERGPALERRWSTAARIGRGGAQ